MHTGAECWDLSLVNAWLPEYTGSLELAYSPPLAVVSVLLPACERTVARPGMGPGVGLISAEQRVLRLKVRQLSL